MLDLNLGARVVPQDHLRRYDAFRTQCTASCVWDAVAKVKTRVRQDASATVRLRRFVCGIPAWLSASRSCAAVV